MKSAKMVFLSLVFILSGSSYSQELPPLEGGVTKKVSLDEIRRNVFKGTPKWAYVRKNPKIDPNLVENLKARINKTSCFPDRRVSVTSGGGYAVYIFGQHEAYSYNSNGLLQIVAINTKPIVRDFTASDYYPSRVANYLYPSGRLSAIAYSIAPLEDYLFNLDGSLQQYCIGTKCYRPDGTLSGTRGYAEICP